MPIPRSIFSLILAALLLSACAYNTGLPEPTARPLATLPGAVEQLHIAPPAEKPTPYRIGPEDLLEVVDLDHPDLFSQGQVMRLTQENPKIRVQPDGSAAFPFIGKSQAAGRTPGELADDLNRAYLSIVKNPNFAVKVSEYRSQRYFVLGQVARPGSYPVDGPVTVLDAFGRAGGTTPEADLGTSYLLRGQTAAAVDFAGLLYRGDIRYNIALRDGDVITVGSLLDKKVYVLGEVKRPGPVQMRDKPMNLSEALAEAGGLDPVTADGGNLLLVRGDYANPSITRMDLRDALGLTAANTFLSPGDRILVAPTGLTNWNRVMSQILPFLQGAEAVRSLSR
jgi:polysaccharide biosynthesis/export protein